MPKKDIPVIRYRWFAWVLAIVLLLVGCGAFIVNGGFNLGVDFESGLSQRIQVAPVGLTVSYSGNEDAVLSILSTDPTQLNFKTSGSVSIEDIRAALAKLGNVKVQTMGASDGQMFQVRLGIKDSDTQSSMEEDIRLALDSHFGKGSVVVLASDYIGAKFSKTLVSSSILAIIVAMALILVYIWFRFRIAYAVSSLLAALFQFEFSSTTIAALLTIIGYSLNNTIVIFDRIRENVGLHQEISLAAHINKSVSQSLSRTIMSAVTTLAAILPLAIFASGDIRMFAVNMGFGILIGTFSSNLLAPAMLYWISKAQKKGNVVEKVETAK
jgi:preprotein translocase subunit SecF